VVEVQVQGLPGEAAPVVKMKVMRIDKEGVALQFLDYDGH
jgi:energy-converting hydrogenase Eha subunit E